MSETLELKVLPVSVAHFEAKYKWILQESALDVLPEYRKYLEQNSEMHHYGRYKTLEDWYNYAEQEYINKDNY